MAKTIKIYVYGRQEKEALIDDEDFDYLNQWRWHLSAKGYAVRKPGKSCIFMHRLLNKTPYNMQTDHINRNKLDNRKSNLRTVSNQQNHFNMPLQKTNTSGFAGVSWDKSRNKWISRIIKNNSVIYLGRFLNLNDATNARKQAELKYYAI